jgi:hemerythrin-like domain-containing protein
MVLSCHDKVRHFARLSRRLGAHIAERGVDDEAAQAAASILRYFDIAAPLHHADEEEDLFPALRALNMPALVLTIDALEAEHEDLERLWQSIRPWLQGSMRHELVPQPDTLHEFAARYVQHAEQEEAELYGAMASLSYSDLARIGRNMSARRGVK